jgi:hypothetical protein
MIVGEEAWIGQYHEEDYDLFFKKIRKKIKQIKPLKVFNPLSLGSGLVKNVIKKKKTPQTSKVNVQAQVSNAVSAKEVELANDRKDLLHEIAAFEEKKVEETQTINENKLAIEQKELESEQGENKKMLYIGLSALGGLIIIGGIVVYIKSRQNQLNALNLQQIQ